VGWNDVAPTRSKYATVMLLLLLVSGPPGWHRPAADRSPGPDYRVRVQTERADVRYVVPVLPLVDPTDGLPLATVRLRDEPLFVHAVRALQAGGRGVLVTAPTGGAVAVREALADDPLVRVLDGGDTLGQALRRVLEHCAADPEAPRLLLVHDPRCPLVPAAFVRDVVAQSLERPHEVLAATRPMTDTVKSVVDGVVRRTVDRDRLVVLASPLALPVSVLERLARGPGLDACTDVEDLVASVREAGVRVQWVPAPSLAWRVDDVASVSVLESVTDAGRRPR
jgi:2-C-methyl-D-erythritol 4-phosphate cytidylyltransferase